MNFFVTIPNRTEKKHQLWLLNKCLESLFQCEPELAKRVVVVDDHSPLDISGVLSKYPVYLIKHKDRVSYSKMINSSIKVAKQNGSDVLITVNNDIEHQVPFLDKLRSIFNSDELISVVGAWLLYPTGETQHSGVEVINNGGAWAVDNYRMKFDRTPPRYCHHVTGAWQAIKLDDHMLMYDELYPFSFEDVDFCLRSWEAGRRVFFSDKIFHIHHESQTRGSGTSERELRSMKRFRTKKFNWDEIERNLSLATNEYLPGTDLLQPQPK